MLVCDKCNYCTIKYQHMVRHLNNKNPCINQIVYVNKSMIDLAKKRPLKEVIEIFNNSDHKDEVFISNSAGMNLIADSETSETTSDNDDN